MGGPEQTIAAPPAGTPPEIWLVVVVVSAAFGFAIQLVRAFLAERSTKTKNGTATHPPLKPGECGALQEVQRLIEDLHHDRDGVPRWTMTKKLETTMEDVLNSTRQTNTKLETLIEINRQQNDLLRKVIVSRSGEHFVHVHDSDDDDDEGA